MPERLVIAVAVVEANDCFLVGRRNASAHQGGLSEFPGGKVEPGESPAEAARRECREETGLEIEIGIAWPPVVYDYGDRTIEIHFHRAAPRAPHHSLLGGFRWVSRAMLATLDFPPANREIVTSLVLCH